MKALWLLWASGFFIGLSVGLQYHLWRIRWYATRCQQLAYEIFDRLIAEQQAKEKVRG